MKKALTLILALALALGLTSCGGAPASSAAAPASSAAPAASSEAVPAPQDPPINLTVVSAGNTPDNAISKGYDKFAELVEEYSGGNITADVYYGSEMGSLSACVDGVFQGTLDIVSCGPSYISGYVPAVQDLGQAYRQSERNCAEGDGRCPRLPAPADR